MNWRMSIPLGLLLLLVPLAAYQGLTAESTDRESPFGTVAPHVVASAASIRPTGNIEPADGFSDQSTSLDHRNGGATTEPALQTQPVPFSGALASGSWHTVRAGDSLRSIAHRYYGTTRMWRTLQLANDLDQRPAIGVRVWLPSQMPSLP